MLNIILITLVTAFLAASVSVLAGALTGAWVVFRVMKGQPPMPTFPRRIHLSDGSAGKEKKEKNDLPPVRA